VSNTITNTMTGLYLSHIVTIQIYEQHYTVNDNITIHGKVVMYSVNLD